MSSAKLALGAAGIYAAYLINSLLTEKMSIPIHPDIPTSTSEPTAKAKTTSSMQIWFRAYLVFFVCCSP